MMASTSYSSSDPITVGGGEAKLGPCISFCLNGDSRVAWKTSWIFHVGGRWRWYMSGDRAWVISNGPSCLGASFLQGYWNRRLVVSNHTLFPTFHGEKVWKFCSLMICAADSWAASASFCASCRASRQFSSAGRKVFPRGGYTWGSYLSIRKNGEALVE